MTRVVEFHAGVKFGTAQQELRPPCSEGGEEEDS
jgi:hypothetical protein